MRSIRALSALVALFTASLALAERASAADASSIVSLVDEVCLAHGGDLPAIEAIAAQRGWRSLTNAELSELRLSDPIGYATGWAVGDGENATFLAVSLPMHNLTPSMRRRLERGDPVRRPPAQSVSMYPPGMEPPASASMQFCQIYFRDAAPDDLVAGVRQLRFQGTPFGVDPSAGPGGGETRTNELRENGTRAWTWSRYAGPAWQMIFYDVPALESGERSIIRVHQRWSEDRS